MNRATIAVGLCCVLAAGAPRAADTATAAVRSHAVDEKSQACRTRPAEPPGRPRVGVVLGGGGARGIAHISVLRTLEQLHVPIDCIAGTSMGALIGALYASGMSVDEIERLVTTLDWPQQFNDALARPERSYRRKRDDDLVISQPGVGIGAKGVKIAAGLLSGERIMLLLEKLVEPVAAIEDFDQLPIPYRAVAADINNGAAVVIRGGDLALAMRASMSLPGIFPAVELGDVVLVDGGVARNLPVDVVRNMGADVVIAVDVGTPLAKITTQTNVLGIADQITGLLIVSNTKEQIATLGERDVLISPPLGDKVGTADFTKSKEALAIGQEGVDAVRDRLARLSIPEAGFAQNRSVRAGRQQHPPVVGFVRLDNQSRYSDAVLLAKIHDPVGKPLDSEQLERDMHGLFGYNTLALSTYEVVQENGNTGLVLHVRDKVQGPNYLELGLSMSSDFEGSFDFNFRVGILQSPINDTGGELRYLLQLGDETRALAEYYQPWGALGHWFFATRAQYDDLKINVFDSDSNKLAEFGATQIGGSVGIGKEFGNYGALSALYQRFTGNADVIVGPPQPSFDLDTGQVIIEGDIDRLDSLYFPRDGYIVGTRYLWSRESLGADRDFEQFDLDTIGAKSFGKHALQLGLRYHVTTSGVAPLQSLYRLGGFSRLSGFQPNELTGQDYAILLAGYQYRLANFYFDQKAYAGGTVEYGNAFQKRSDMEFSAGIWNASVYAGIDSVIGPILLGAGFREGGSHTVFLVVGQKF